jgi:serine/threonine protein kinase
MGEVYRARDPKLRRDVAIKVLPDDLARDADRLARLHREAQLLAALNHPHIAHIHGLEDSGGTPALVLELVEGPTLADRLASTATSSRRT